MLPGEGFLHFGSKHWVCTPSLYSVLQCPCGGLLGLKSLLLSFFNLSITNIFFDSSSKGYMGTHAAVTTGYAQWKWKAKDCSTHSYLTNCPDNCSKSRPILWNNLCRVWRNFRIPFVTPNLKQHLPVLVLPPMMSYILFVF